MNLRPYEALFIGEKCALSAPQHKPNDQAQKSRHAQTGHDVSLVSGHTRERTHCATS
jgi:hypothetical protein